MSGSEHNDPMGKNAAVAAPSAKNLVTIALSAAGLPPLRDVITSLPANFPAAIVVLQHIGAASDLPSILGRSTPLRVKFAETDELLCSGTVYVCPPQAHTIVTPNRRLHLSHAPAVRLSRPSADWLFESVAASYTDCSITIVLSGNLSDGARGVGWLRKAGGYVIAQLPSTCGFASMPRAAIDTGFVNAVLRPEEIAEALQLAVARQRSLVDVSNWEEPFLSRN